MRSVKVTNARKLKRQARMMRVCWSGVHWDQVLVVASESGLVLFGVSILRVESRL